MIAGREVASSLYGAFRLALFDEAGFRYFDSSLDGFWRSFWAAAIIGPFYVLLLALRWRAGYVDADVVRYVALELIAYVIAWVAYPLAMESLSRMMNCRDRYLGYITAYNWATVLQNALYMPVAMLAVTGAVAADTANSLGFVILIAILIYTWFITYKALDLPAAGAAGLVLMDLLLSISINAITERAL